MPTPRKSGDPYPRCQHPDCNHRVLRHAFCERHRPRAPELKKNPEAAARKRESRARKARAALSHGIPTGWFV